MHAAAAAILASGYRPATSEPRHLQLVIQALPKTAGLAAERVLVPDAFRAARNRSDYPGVPISDVVAREYADAAAATLREARVVGREPPRAVLNRQSCGLADGPAA